MAGRRIVAAELVRKQKLVTAGRAVKGGSYSDIKYSDYANYFDGGYDDYSDYGDGNED